MLKSFFSILILLGLGQFLVASNISEYEMPCASIMVNSQTEVDNLDLTACTFIMGDLVIRSTVSGDSITDLSVFANITSVSGNLIISDNAQLESLSGLNQVTKIGGQLVISKNAKLQNFSDLILLERIEQDFLLTSNKSLKGNSLTPNLKYIGDTFHISLNDSLLSPPSQPQLDTILGHLIIDQNLQLDHITDYNVLKVLGGVSIGSNPKLLTISGFSTLTKNNGLLIIERNDLLSSISGFQSLEEQVGDIQIKRNDVLTSIQGFTELDKVTGSLKIFFNDILNSFVAFSSLDSVTMDCTMSLANVVDFTPISEIQYVGERYEISDNYNISNTDFLLNLLKTDELYINNNPALVTISEPNTNPLSINNIDIADNNSLTLIQGFTQVHELDYLRFEDNDALQTISAFNKLESLGELNIEGEDNLQSIGGFSNLTFVGYMTILESGRLKNISEFNTVDLVIEELDIIELDSLTSITGFQNVLEITEIQIEDNPLLTSMIGFYNLTICSDLRIADNDELEEFCPFYNLFANEDNSVDYSRGFGNGYPSANEILERGDCNLYEIDDAKYISLTDALMAAIANDTIRYIPREDEDYNEFEIDGDIVIPVDVVLVGNSTLQLYINGTVIIDGTLITKEEAAFTFDNGMVLNGTIKNTEEGRVSIYKDVIVNGTIINKDEASFNSYTSSSTSTIINGSITNEIDARMNLEKVFLKGMIDNYGELRFSN